MHPKTLPRARFLPRHSLLKAPGRTSLARPRGDCPFSLTQPTSCPFPPLTPRPPSRTRQRLPLLRLRLVCPLSCLLVPGDPAPESHRTSSPSPRRCSPSLVLPLGTHQIMGYGPGRGHWYPLCIQPGWGLAQRRHSRLIRRVGALIHVHLGSAAWPLKAGRLLPGTGAFAGKSQRQPASSFPCFVAPFLPQSLPNNPPPRKNPSPSTASPQTTRHWGNAYFVPHPGCFQLLSVPSYPLFHLDLATATQGKGSKMEAQKAEQRAHGRTAGLEPMCV